MELDRYEDDEIIGEPMSDIIFNQINDLTERISTEFPGAQMPQWLHALIHARPNTISVKSVNAETEKNILDTLMEWCDSDYNRLDDPERYEDDWINPDKAVLSVASAIDICNRMRHSMKLPIKILAYTLKEVETKTNISNVLDEYATIDEVNNVLKEYAQLTYLDENYITNARIEEEYLNHEAISNLYYDREDIDEKFNEYYSKSELDTKLFQEYYNCDEIDEHYMKIYTAEAEFTTLTNRINALENENNELKAKLAALESNSGGATTKEITKQIVKHSLTLSNIEYDEELFEGSGWHLYDDSNTKSSNFTYDNGTITLSDTWSTTRDHFLIFLWNNDNITQKYTIEVIVHELRANVNGKNISSNMTVSYTDGDLVFDYPVTMSTTFSLTINKYAEITLPTANLEWKIYSEKTNKPAYLLGLFNRLENINPDREYYSADECDNKYVKKTDYDKLLARVAALEAK